MSVIFWFSVELSPNLFSHLIYWVSEKSEMQELTEDDSIRVVLEQMGVHQDQVHQMNITQWVIIRICSKFLCDMFHII